MLEIVAIAFYWSFLDVDVESYPSDDALERVTESYNLPEGHFQPDHSVESIHEVVAYWSDDEDSRWT